MEGSEINMMKMECRLGPATVSVSTDADLHPEILESLLTQVTIKTVIVYGELVKQAQETGVVITDEWSIRNSLVLLLCPWIYRLWMLTKNHHGIYVGDRRWQLMNHCKCHNKREVATPAPEPTGVEMEEEQDEQELWLLCGQGVESFQIKNAQTTWSNL